MAKDKLYKVTMWNPLYTFIMAKDVSDAIEKTQEKQDWESPNYAGCEKFEVELMKKGAKKCTKP